MYTYICTGSMHHVQAPYTMGMNHILCIYMSIQYMYRLHTPYMFITHVQPVHHVYYVYAMYPMYRQNKSCSVINV